MQNKKANQNDNNYWKQEAQRLLKEKDEYLNKAIQLMQQRTPYLELISYLTKINPKRVIAYSNEIEMMN